MILGWIGLGKQTSIKDSFYCIFHLFPAEQRCVCPFVCSCGASSVPGFHLQPSFNPEPCSQTGTLTQARIKTLSSFFFCKCVHRGRGLAFLPPRSVTALYDSVSSRLWAQMWRTFLLAPWLETPPPPPFLPHTHTHNFRYEDQLQQRQLGRLQNVREEKFKFKFEKVQF